MSDAIIAFALVLLAVVLPIGIPAAMTWWELRQPSRRVTPADFWHHDCEHDGTRWAVAKGSPCSWCGRTEAGSAATEAVEMIGRSENTRAA